ncbi:MAG TPA: hypothetical protein VEQ61_09105 [Thermoleophilaceae bacterium]|nr:hypothetical protein [Thermoleophilaceae bacterium]
MAVYLAAVVVAAISIVVGGALCRLLRTPAWTAPAVGVSACMLIALVSIRLPGHAWTAFAALALAAVVSAAFLVHEGVEARRAALALPVSLLILLACSLPFIAYWRLGELGPGFTADLALHMAQADALRQIGPSASVTSAGYPTGPHALMAALAEGLGLSMRSAFLGLLLAIPVLTGVTALGALQDLPAGRRILGAALVGLPYLVASYYVQASFKELVFACCFLAFTLILRDAPRLGAIGARRALALALTSAGGVAAFGLPALAWPLAVLLVLGLLERIATGRSPVALSMPRPKVLFAAGAALIAAAVLVIAGDFLGEGGAGAFLTTRGIGGNFSGHLSPLEAVGVWPSSDFRFRPRGQEPLFWLIVAFGGAVALYALRRCWLRREMALLSAALGGMLIYLGARPVTLAYNSGKALVIVAPVLTLVVVRALLEDRPHAAGMRAPRRLAWAALALAFIAASAGSTAMALRAGVPRPQDRPDELGALRPLLRGKPTLYLGRSDWAGWDLRGARLAGFQASPVLSTPLAGASRKPLRVREDPADVDTLTAAELDRYTYVVAPRSAYASAFPANFRPVRRSRSFVVWKRSGPTAPRRILREGSAPGAVLDCGSERRPGIAFVRPAPVIAGERSWRLPAGDSPPEPGAMSPGGSLVQTLDLGPGVWEISVSYLSPVELSLRAGELAATLPADADDGASLFRAGRLSVGSEGASVEVVVSAEQRRGIDRLIQLRAVAATRVDDPGRIVALRQACGQYVDWLAPEPRA